MRSFVKIKNKRGVKQPPWGVSEGMVYVLNPWIVDD